MLAPSFNEGITRSGVVYDLNVHLCGRSTTELRTRRNAITPVLDPSKP